MKLNHVITVGSERKPTLAVSLLPHKLPKQQGNKPKTGRVQESKALINEVLFHPDTSLSDSSKCRKFIEIFRPSRFGLRGCRVKNDDGSFRLDFGKAFENTYAPYYSIKHKSTLKTEYLVWQRKRIIWVHDLDLRPIDGVAFICDETIMDYVAWKECGILLDGPLYQAAVDAGAWSQRTIVETGPVAIGGGYQSPGLQKGECIGRDKDSTDTDSVTD